MSPLRAHKTKLDDLALPPNATLLWKYDYGSTSNYKLTLLEDSPLAADESTP